MEFFHEMHQDNKHRKTSIMKTKKSFKADLEKNKSIFFQIGLLTAISLSLIAFEWSSTDTKKSVLAMEESFDIDNIEVVNTFHEKEKKKDPVRPIPEFINISNDDNFIQDFVPEDITIDENTEVPEYDFGLIPEEKVTDEVFMRVEEMPTFRGGDTYEFWKYIQKTVDYPEEAREMGLEGTVTVSFVVDETGHVIKI